MKSSGEQMGEDNMRARHQGAPGDSAGGAVLSIDMTLCRGRGACIDFLSESLTEDADGYPVPLNGTLRKGFALSPRDVAMARQAVEDCPMRALKFQN